MLIARPGHLSHNQLCSCAPLRALLAELLDPHSPGHAAAGWRPFWLRLEENELDAAETQRLLVHQRTCAFDEACCSLGYCGLRPCTTLLHVRHLGSQRKPRIPPPPLSPPIPPPPTYVPRKVPPPPHPVPCVTTPVGDFEVHTPAAGDLDLLPCRVGEVYTILSDELRVVQGAPYLFARRGASVGWVPQRCLRRQAHLKSSAD